MPDASSPQIDAAEAARLVAAALHARGIEYAVGGAIAMNFWSEPRGTIDVDVTVFLPPDQPTQIVRVLQQIGCEVNTSAAIGTIEQHGFCQAQFKGIRVDVFIPTNAFFDRAKPFRSTVRSGDGWMTIWNAEAVAVLKLLFFRDKDLTDLRRMIKIRGPKLDRAWVREQIVAMCGESDPRVAAWDELTRAMPA